MRILTRTLISLLLLPLASIAQRSMFYSSNMSSAGVTPVAVVCHAMAAGSGGSNPATTSACNTTGSSLLIISITDFSNDCSADSVSDSKGNTWTLIVHKQAAGVTDGCLYLAWDHGGSPLSVGSGHTFSVTGSYPALEVATFSNTQVSSTPLDQSNSSNSPATGTIQPGSITPTTNNQLVVTMCGSTIAGAFSIDGSYSITDQQQYDGLTRMGGALAYIVQTTAAATNPTWTSGISAGTVAIIASFKHN